jgi:hypothetical protein
MGCLEPKMPRATISALGLLVPCLRAFRPFQHIRSVERTSLRRAGRSLVTRLVLGKPDSSFMTAFSAAILASSSIGACPQDTSSSGFRAAHIIQ